MTATARRSAVARILRAALAVVLAAGLPSTGLARAAAHGPVTALFTSLPIVLPETSDVRSLLRADKPRHWALNVLERRGRVRSIDVLESRQLARTDLLVMAQPRPLAPQENVALDAWVRGGGHVLLFADPVLTAASAFAPGDRRRPQDLVLLSPILTRWGLSLRLDPAQAAGERMVAWGSMRVPVDLAGRFALLGRRAHCRLVAGGLGAHCRIGRGTVLALADAALLDGQGADPAARAVVLDRLLAESIARY